MSRLMGLQQLVLSNMRLNGEHRVPHSVYLIAFGGSQSLEDGTVQKNCWPY